MGYSSNVFLFVFLPVFLIIYSIIRIIEVRLEIYERYIISDISLLLFSFLFYSWANVFNAVILLALIIFVYLIGCVLDDNNSKRPNFLKSSRVVKKVVLIVAIVFTLMYLLVCKYNDLYFDWNVPILLRISFISFSAISYLVDVYNGEDSSTFLDAALYICLFPKVISGPIVIWNNYLDAKDKRIFSLEMYCDGIKYIIIERYTKL